MYNFNDMLAFIVKPKSIKLCIKKRINRDGINAYLCTPICEFYADITLIILWKCECRCVFKYDMRLTNIFTWRFVMLADFIQILVQKYHMHMHHINVNITARVNNTKLIKVFNKIWICYIIFVTKQNYERDLKLI